MKLIMRLLIPALALGILVFWALRAHEEFSDGTFVTSHVDEGSNQLPEPLLEHAQSRHSEPMRRVIGSAHGIKERNGIFGYATSAYGATFDRGTVQFASHKLTSSKEKPFVSLSLNEIRVGDSTVAKGGSVAPLYAPNTNAITYRRDSIEERYLLGSDSIEQVFVLPELPARRGEIIVKTEVLTNLTAPKDGTCEGQLVFLTFGMRTTPCVPMQEKRSWNLIEQMRRRS